MSEWGEESGPDALCAMAEFSPWPEKRKASEGENAAPAEPVQLALTGGGHSAAGKGPLATPAAPDNRLPRSMVVSTTMLLSLSL